MRPPKTAGVGIHIVVVRTNKEQFNNGIIDGYLALDARTGNILCANLPLFD